MIPADSPAHVQFQSTPLREGRRGNFLYVGCFQCFNPRPCARGDMIRLSANQHQEPFQSTPLREGRP